MKSGIKSAACAALAFGAVALAASTASAAIVCNMEGACWHVMNPYAYQGRPGLSVHADNWRWAPGARYVWREHAGRGYWRRGAWIVF